jgi:hypothetical protein
MASKTREPFGQPDCESELRLLKGAYSKLYFDETPFNESAIAPETYLIIGRRGSGKTALSQYFSFQRVLDDPISVDVDEPAVFQKVLSDVAAHASDVREIAIPRLRKIWEYVIWCVIFEHTKNMSNVINEACDMSPKPGGRVSYLVNAAIEKVISVFREVEEKVVDARLDLLLSDDRAAVARAEVLRLATTRPIIIAIDTLEKYDVSNDSLMNAMAALVQCAADFNVEYSDRGIHLKIFMSGEIFPYLKEEVLQNPSKSVKHAVYLLWRPKDLLRLISWRFYQYLRHHNLLRDESKGQIDWEDHSEVMEKVWRPYFGFELTNNRGLRERTFAYVLRHTQMRPRQLIMLCNAIARRAIKARTFPLFAEDDIKTAVKDEETELAGEIINSFSSVYPHVSTIVDALMKMPMIFMGNELDKRASQSASEWPVDMYSPARFRRLVAELGVVGRVRRHNETAGYIDSDFEYSLRDRMPLTHRDECVIHPMFYRRLNVEFNSSARVMPFSTERESEEVNSDFYESGRASRKTVPFAPRSRR